MSSVSSISSNLMNFKIPLKFRTSTATRAFSLVQMAQGRHTPKPISISGYWVPNYPPYQPSKTPPEFPSPPQTNPSSVPLEVPGPHNIPDFDPIPLEQPADPPPLTPGPNPGPHFPGPPMPSPPTPDAPRPPIPSPQGPDVPKSPPDVYPPNEPDLVPEIGPSHPTQPDMPPPMCFGNGFGAPCCFLC